MGFIIKNELLFLLQTIFVSGAVLGALALGKEALVAAISILFVLANLFVVKQITLFGFDVTSADVYIIGAVLGFNLLQEYFGKKIAQKTIWISFFISFVVVVLSQMHLWYMPNPYDVTQGSFIKILGFLPRIVAASFIAHIGAQYFRLFFYAWLKKISNNRYLLLRNIASMISEQALDTVLFGFIGLYGIVHRITDVFIISFLIKVATILLTTPAIVLSKKIVKRRS